MHRMYYRLLSEVAAYCLAVCLAVPYALIFTPAAMAQGRVITSAAVLPIVDGTGQQSEVLSDKATDEVALALEATRQFRVVLRADLERELAALQLAPPLSDLQKARLGARLQVDKIISGKLMSLKLNRKTGQVEARLELRSFDIKVGATLNGALATQRTRPLPGWEGDDTLVLNEGIRAVAETAVREMLTARTPRGNVDVVDPQGNVSLNIGTNHGVKVGDRLMVMRPTWEPDLEMVVMYEVGEVRVKQVEPRLSEANRISGGFPRVGDKVYMLYTPPEALKKEFRSRKMESSARMLCGILGAFGIIAIGTGGDPSSPTALTTHIAQSHPGGETYIAVEPHIGHTKLQGTQAWLIFRGPTAGFIAEADDNNYLVGAVRGKHLSLYEDHPERQVGLSFAFAWQFIDETGEQADGDVSITYNHLELVEGDTYYYKVRRVHDPIRPQVPIADTAQDDLVDVDFTIDPEDALSEATRKAAGPVTYFRPPGLQAPSNGLKTVNPSNVTFEWEPMDGADQYQVQVYDNSLLRKPAVYKGPVQSSTGEVLMRHKPSGFTFGSNETYYWVVGAKRAGEAQPVSGSEKGWIFSEVWSFSTPPTPPGPTGSGSYSPPPGGWWQQIPRGK